MDLSVVGTILAIANFLIMIGGIVGGWSILRSTLAKSESEVQTRVREALSAENEVLRGRVQRLETENRQQARIMQLIITTLRKLYGIELDIDDDVITLRSNGNVSRINAGNP